MSPLVALTLLSLLAGSEGGRCNETEKSDLDRCLASIMPYMPKVGLPHTSIELSNMCRAFKGGMTCVDRYTEICLDPAERQDLERNLQGARSFLAFLCDDPVFQREYLSYGACLRDVSDGWDFCHHRYNSLINQQHKSHNVSEATRDHDICCIRESLLTCVYRVSKYLCGRHEASFVKKVTATISYNDLQETKCRNVNLRTCAGTVVWRGRSRVVVVVALLMLLLLLTDGEVVIF